MTLPLPSTKPATGWWIDSAIATRELVVTSPLLGWWVIHVLQPTGIASAGAFGVPVVVQAKFLAPVGIPSAEAFGSSNARYDQFLTPTGIPSSEALGSPTVFLGGPVIENAGGIPSDEAFGTPIVIRAQFLLPSGIISSEAFGTPVRGGNITLPPSGIASSEAFGATTVTAPPSVVPPTFISQNSIVGNSLTMPTHATGDLIIAWAYRTGSTTPPTLASGYTSFFSATGSNSRSDILAYRIATSGSESSGTWTNASGLHILIFRKGATNTWVVPTTAATSTAASGTTITYASGVTSSSANAWYVRTAQSVWGQGTVPTGWTNRGENISSNEVISRAITAGPTATAADSVGGNTVSQSQSAAWRTHTFVFDVT